MTRVHAAADRKADGLKLSVVLPYYRKLEEFRAVFPINLPYLQRDDCEIVLVLDEPSQEREVLELISRTQGIRWRVIVNDRAHEWRAPSVAINVGIRHAEGELVLVVSPESAFASDVPSQAIMALDAFPQCVVLGMVAFLDHDSSTAPPLVQEVASIANDKNAPRTLYGSMAATRADLFRVHGYDETISAWGGDDDNIRIRLEMAGRRLLARPDLNLVHVTLGQRTRRSRDRDESLERSRAIFSPAMAEANPAGGWGQEFGRVVREWRTEEVLNDPARAVDDAATALSPHRAVPVASRVACRACGRHLHYRYPQRECECRNTGLQPSLDRFATLPPLGDPRRICCVMQLRNEARFLSGCLAHLADHVDAVIALDDGSTDDTARILERHPLVAEILSNAPRESHVWDERENKRRLLTRARDLGYDWVLVCDADERYETNLLRNLRRIAAAFPPAHLGCIAVRVRELWDTPMRYRIDGVWGDKVVARFFALPDEISFADDKPLHGRWPPDELRRKAMPYQLGYNLYHCKTISRADRVRRRDFYRAVDPEQRFQPSGYDYLIEEGHSLRTEEIPRNRRYDVSTLPDGYVPPPEDHHGGAK